MVDVRTDFLRDETPGVTFHRRSSGGDQKLFKVPGNVRAFDGGPSNEQWIRHQRVRVVVRCRQRRFQPIKNRMSSFTVHDTFLHKHQFRLITVPGPYVLQIRQDFVAVPVLLMAELIAGKSQDNKLLAELVSESVHLGVIPGGRASQRGYVLDKNRFPFKHVHLELRGREPAAR